MLLWVAMHTTMISGAQAAISRHSSLSEHPLEVHKLTGTHIRQLFSIISALPFPIPPPSLLSMILPAEFLGSNYQTATHFHFGDEKGFSSSSVYAKGTSWSCADNSIVWWYSGCLCLLTDFDGGSVRGVKKPLPPPPPGPSKVSSWYS